MEENQTNEEWRQIEGYPCYLVSDKGRVKSLRNPKYPKILKQGDDGGGYKQVVINSGDGYGKGKKKHFRVHRLVAMAFIPNSHPEKRRDVGHWDSDPSNNSKENLYWCTPAENNRNPITLQRNRDARPEAVKKTSKAVYVYDEDLNQVSAFSSTASAARILNTSQGNIASCCGGALPRYLGRIWSYEVLDDIKQREALEQRKKAQRLKNKQSTKIAAFKYYYTMKNENSERYQEWLRRARECSTNYYQKNREKVLQKMKKRRRMQKLQKQTNKQ